MKAPAAPGSSASIGEPCETNNEGRVRVLIRELSGCALRYSPLGQPGGLMR